MKERRIYLDTSAIVKRYLLEPGTEIVDSIYKDAHRREVLIGFSSWNIGEASVVFDKYERMGVINEARKVFEKFLLESRTLVLSGSLRILSITPDVISRSVALVFRYHIYITDALQLSCTREGFDEFATADRKLAEVAENENIKTILIE